MSYYIVMMSNISRISDQVDSIKNLMCPCKAKILKIKWAYWIEWYFEIAQHLDSISIEDLFITMDETQEEYTREIYAQSDLPEPLVKAFNSIHGIAMEEFKYILQNRTIYTKVDTIRFLGDLLALLTQTSIFEMTELNVPCGKCSYNCGVDCKLIKNKSNFTILVNDLFNVNSFGTKKIEMLSRI